jgi:hypothetical protein
MLQAQTLLLAGLLLVSALSLGVPPSWTRDNQIDAGTAAPTQEK